MEKKFKAKNTVTGLYFAESAPGHILCGFYEKDPNNSPLLSAIEASNIKLTFANVELEDWPVAACKTDT